MKTTKVSFEYKGKKFSFEAEKCEGARQGLGLMFKSKNTKPLIFDFGKLTELALTSLFVFFPFVAVWFDEKDNVVAVDKINPFRLVIPAPKPFSRLLEIPINSEHFEKAEFLVGRKI